MKFSLQNFKKTVSKQLAANLSSLGFCSKIAPWGVPDTSQTRPRASPGSPKAFTDSLCGCFLVPLGALGEHLAPPGQWLSAPRGCFLRLGTPNTSLGVVFRFKIGPRIVDFPIFCEYLLCVFFVWDISEFWYMKSLTSGPPSLLEASAGDAKR